MGRLEVNWKYLAKHETVSWGVKYGQTVSDVSKEIGHNLCDVQLVRVFIDFQYDICFLQNLQIDTYDINKLPPIKNFGTKCQSSNQTQNYFLKSQTINLMRF